MKNNLLPFPLIYVINDRPSMPMRMDFLIGYGQTVAHKIQMIDIAQPYPRNVAVLGDAGLAVPLRFFPQLLGDCRIW